MSAVPTVIMLQGPEAVEALREIAAALRPEAEDRFLSLGDAADELGLSRETLASMAHRGEVPCRNVGSGGRAKFIFSKKALSRWLEGR